MSCPLPSEAVWTGGRLRIRGGGCSKEEIDAKEVVVNVRGEVREDAKNVMRSTLPLRIFNSY